MDEKTGSNIDGIVEDMFANAYERLRNYNAEFSPEEIGVVTQVGNGIVRVSGLPNVRADEVVRFPGDNFGIAFNLERDSVSIVMTGQSARVEAGMEVRRTGRIIDVPVGDALLGRVIDPLGAPLDNGGVVAASTRYPIERDCPAIMDRAPVNVPLQTGIIAVDALIPIGRGQRELIVSDRQIGKTAIAVDTIINQRDKDMICVYCAIGQQNSATAKVIADLKKHGAMGYTIVVVASGDDSPGMNFIAPYAATSIAEYFMESGRDALIIYDDLSRHARSYRELSLLLRRPPAREAFPGDIFYIHSRLLERATHLSEEKGGGSLTALPIVETESQNIAAYIPTNLVSITDGQIYLSAKLFQEGKMPPIDIGRSVSRVGGKAQIPAYRDVAGDLRLTYSQFEELELFERFSTRLDEGTRSVLDRGHRIREVLKQPQYRPVPVAEQIAVLLAVTSGILNDIAVEQIHDAKIAITALLTGELGRIAETIRSGKKLSPDDRDTMISKMRDAVASLGA
ncbi:MAG: alternate F1F0 ATPase, F1 subunit alpha [Spirochaetota bacterium]